MKKIYLITQLQRINVRICEQLRELFGTNFEITGLWDGTYDRIDFKDGLVIISSSWVFQTVKELIDPGVNYIIAERVLNFKHLDELSLIEDGSDVIVFNYYGDICESIIKQLKDVGFNRLNFIPATSDEIAGDGYRYAVVSGEIPNLPRIAETIIDIGERMLDIPSLVEIVKRLELPGREGKNIHYQTINKILELLEKYKNELNKKRDITSLYRTVVDNSSSGILYLNSEGNILISNRSMELLFGSSASNIERRNISEVFGCLKNWKPDEPEKEYLAIAGKEIVLSKLPVKRNNLYIGIVLMFDDPLKIEHEEFELRRRERIEKYTAIYTFSDIITDNTSMKKNIDFARKIAQGTDTVLIQGESGTGKELFAQAIHNNSSRYRGPFVPVNFSGLSESLLESELFGYHDGAFTGALKGGKKGLFEKAHGGTIFLDEIGDAPVEFQTKLLRVLQERQVKRVGGNEIIPIDIRVIAASNLSIVEAVRQGCFRKDLYYRLNVLPINLPCLRERKEDIHILLIHYFKERYKVNDFCLEKYFSSEALDLLSRYDWPGNVRQLINTVKYLSYVKNNEMPIKVSDLPADVRDYFHSQAEIKPETASNIINDETEWILRCIHKNDGAGRKFLSRQAESECRNLSEGRIRTLLSKLSTEGYIVSKVGNTGSTITEKGEKVIYK